jgi:hypothetical protein
MTKNKKFSLIVIGALVLTLAFGLVAFAPIGTASAAVTDEGFNHGRRPGGFRPGGFDNNDEALAAALGISLEELQSAHEVVKTAALEQAVADGKLTQEQADQFSEESFFNRRARFMPMAEQSESLLAEALGISVEELQAARQQVQQAAIDQALADGKLTEEQAALMEAHQALQNYIQKDEMIAKALGIPVDELTAAQEDGQRLPDLITELGIELEDFQSNMQALREEALGKAVQDGIITQEQADQILESDALGTRGLGACGFPAGRRNFERPEGFPGRPGNGGTNFQDMFGPTTEG